YPSPQQDAPNAVLVSRRLQGAVLTFGKGRVAVFGEAAMFSAQLAGPDKEPMGMNASVAKNNPQFLINVMHWLAGVFGSGRGETRCSTVRNGTVLSHESMGREGAGARGYAGDGRHSRAARPPESKCQGPQIGRAHL